MGTLTDVTDVPHTKSGFAVSASNSTPEPSALGSDGGNVGLVDGSVSWRKQAVMHQHYVVFTQSGAVHSTTIIGYW